MNAMVRKRPMSTGKKKQSKRTRGDAISMSKPCVGEAGRTGEWRSSRPVVEAGKCLAVKQGKVVCQLCWIHCPDACIAKGVGPRIDMEFCKGCGICAQVCPTGAIVMTIEPARAKRGAAEEKK